MKNKLKDFEDYVKKVFEEDLCDTFNLSMSKIDEIAGNINAKRKNIITEVEKLAHEKKISKEDNTYYHDKLRKYKKLPKAIRESFDLSYRGYGYFKNLALLDQTSLSTSLELVNSYNQYIGIAVEESLNYLIINSKDFFALIIFVINQRVGMYFTRYSHGQLINNLIDIGIRDDFTKYYNQLYNQSEYLDDWISKFNILLKSFLNKDTEFYSGLENYISSETIKYIYKWYCYNKNFIKNSVSNKKIIEIFLEYIEKFLSNYGYKF